jgi:hypothetical protein
LSKVTNINDNRTLCAIVHYGDESLTWDCVESIAAFDFLDIIIADNDPAQKIEIPERFKTRAQLFRAGGEAGFAQANNLAVRAGRTAEHQSVLLLNNDTLVLSDAVQRLRELLDRDRVGAVGPCMPYASCPDKIWACGGVIKKLRVTIEGLTAIEKPEPYAVDYLPGAAILCRLSVWDMVQGLPEKYFLALEEAEFAVRVKKLGYSLMVDPGAKILHRVGMSSDRQPMYLYNGVRNRLKFGMFLWGAAPGFLLAAIWTALSMRRHTRGFALWWRAVRDEMRGAALDKQTLQEIKSFFGS